ALAWLCGSALAQVGVINSSKNPQQVATLHWYPANLTTSFAIPSGAGPMAFDGDNIWVMNGSNGVSKVRASDGAMLGTFSVGKGPQRALFDGVNIWVTNFLDGTVTKLRASDGANLGTFRAGTNPPSGNTPIGLAFDGTNIWVGDPKTATVSKLRAADGT